MKKTRVARSLDAHRLRYPLVETNVDEANLSAERAASKGSLPPEGVFKTPVVREDRRGVFLARDPEGAVLDLKEMGEHW